MTTRKPLKKRVRLLEEGVEEREMKNNSSKSLVESSKSGSSSRSSLRPVRKRPRISDGDKGQEKANSEEEVKSKRVSSSDSLDLL